MYDDLTNLLSPLGKLFIEEGHTYKKVYQSYMYSLCFHKMIILMKLVPRSRGKMLSALQSLLISPPHAQITTLQPRATTVLTP